MNSGSMEESKDTYSFMPFPLPRGGGEQPRHPHIQVYRMKLFKPEWRLGKSEVIVQRTERSLECGPYHRPSTALRWIYEVGTREPKNLSCHLSFLNCLI